MLRDFASKEIAEIFSGMFLSLVLHYQLFSSVTILGPLAVTTLFFLKLGNLSYSVHPQQFQFLLVSGPKYISIHIFCFLRS